MTIPKIYIFNIFNFYVNLANWAYSILYYINTNILNTFFLICFLLSHHRTNNFRRLALAFFIWTFYFVVIPCHNSSKFRSFLRKLRKLLIAFGKINKLNSHSNFWTIKNYQNDGNKIKRGRKGSKE